MKLLVVHLSDIHLRAPADLAVGKIPFIAKALQNEEAEIAGAVVVVSGDIAFSGTREEYGVANECLRALQSEVAAKTRVQNVSVCFRPRQS